MKKKTSSQTLKSNLPVSKQTAGGVAGAVVGSVVGGPVGAIVGGIAGTVMGNRAAKGKTLVSSATKKRATSAVKAVKEKLPTLKSRLTARSSKNRTSKTKPTKSKATAAKTLRSRKRKPTRTTARRSR